MGTIISYPDIPVRTPVPDGKQRICIAGWPASPHVTRAASIARTLQQKYPNTYETWFFFSFGSNVRGANGDGKGGIYQIIKDLLSEEDKTKLLAHKTVPFVWIETSNSIKGIGGRDNLCEWVNGQPNLLQDEQIKALVSLEPGILEAVVDTTPGTAN